MMQIEIKNHKIKVPLKGKDEWLVLKPEEEAEQYLVIFQKADREIQQKYASKTKPTEAKLALRGKEAPDKEEKKQLKAELKQLEETIASEIKEQIK